MAYFLGENNLFNSTVFNFKNKELNLQIQLFLKKCFFLKNSSNDFSHCEVHFKN